MTGCTVGCLGCAECLWGFQIGRNWFVLQIWGVGKGCVWVWGELTGMKFGGPRLCRNQDGDAEC